MRFLLITIAIIGLAAGFSPLASAQLVQTNPAVQTDPAGSQPIGSPPAYPMSGSVAADPNSTDTRLNDQATSPPGSAGPVEGGKRSDAPAALPKANSNGEGGGVQNPGLGSGVNGSSPRE
jgi:hypothetical protein